MRRTGCLFYFKSIYSLSGIVDRGTSGFSDSAAELGLEDTKLDLCLLGGLGGAEARVQELLEEVVDDALGHVVNVLERVCGRLERDESLELDDASKLGQVLHAGLDLGQRLRKGRKDDFFFSFPLFYFFFYLANLLRLEALKQSIPGRGLKQQEKLSLLNKA